MSVEKISKKKCTGCGACFNVCTRQCIKMIEDKEGFFYPEINKAECNECNLCQKVCPVFEKKIEKNNYDMPLIYAAWSNNDKIRINSTSGGIFSELALKILEREGYICGAEYAENFEIKHCIIQSYKELEKLRQSKYAQSNIGTIYKEITELIKKEKLVLFCGTPCQCEALHKIIGEQENLYLVDFICRGVNSPKALRKFIENIEAEFQSRATKVWFKNKTYGWNRFATKVEMDNGTFYLKDRNEDYFMKGYIGYNLYMRPSCGNCMFKNTSKISDITLADFWGVRLNNKNEDVEKGISLVMINSLKGNKLFNDINSRIFYEKKTLGDIYNGNPYLNQSPYIDPLRRKYFFSHLDKERFDVLINHCIKIPTLFKHFYCLKKYLKNLI